MNTDLNTYIHSLPTRIDLKNHVAKIVESHNLELQTVKQDITLGAE